MALGLPEQLKTLIENKKHILVTFRPDAAGDAIGSAIALALMIERMGRMVDIISADFALPKAYTFLPLAERINGNFSHLQKFIITLDVHDSGVEELSYDMKDEKLRIFITPRRGFLTRDQVRTAQTDFKYDLIITLDTQDLASLGNIYENNTDLFYKTPIVNIDHNPANEHFGHINIVDVTATSTAEVLFDTMKQMNEEMVDAGMATALLTGMIANTHSFKTDNVTPRTLSTASTLVTLGANREEIIHHLYRTRSIATLKLWGFALSHMQIDRATGLVWSTITRDDFIRSGAHENDLKDIIDELISNAPEAKTVLLFHEHADKPAIHVIAKGGRGQDIKTMLAPFHPSGEKHMVSLTINDKNLSAVETMVIDHIRSI